MTDADLLADKTPTTRGYLALILQKIAGATSKNIEERIAKRLEPLMVRISTLETRCGALSMLAGRGQAAEQITELETLIERVKSLEARPEMSYRGVWHLNEDYRLGDFVTHNGSIFHCWTPTKDRPGESNAWQLAVKKGADGKGLR